jgi:putative sugar O-methyltransferase
MKTLNVTRSNYGNLPPIWNVQYNNPMSFNHLFTSLEKQSPENLAALLSNFQAVCNGHISFEYFESQSNPAQIETRKIELLDVAAKYGVPWDAHAYASSTAGNAIGFNCSSGVASVVSLRHGMDAADINKLVSSKQTVLEIGGGFGGLASKLLQLNPNVKYVICDLPPSMAIAYFYLRCTFPHLKIHFATSTEDDTPCNVLLLSEQFKHSAHIKPNLVFSSYSLCELSAANIAEYKTLIKKWQPDYIMSENCYTNIFASQPSVLSYAIPITFDEFEDYTLLSSSDAPCNPTYAKRLLYAKKP